MNRRTCLAIIFTGWVAAGCQSLHVQSQYDHQVAFADFHTFCWVAAPAWLHNDPRLHMDLVEPLVQRAVEAQLSAKGFRKADCATADIQVTFTGGLHEGYTLTPRPGGVTVAVYTEGEWFTSSSGGMNVKGQRVPTLVIQMRRPGSDQVLWEGAAMGNFPRPANEAQREQRIQTAVQKIMQKFPPPAGK